MKYSEIRKLINIEPLKDSENLQAELTHYFHSPESNSKLFVNKKSENAAIDLGIKKKNKLLIDWDVPFPPPEKHDFSFIDLFAGVGGIRIAYQRVGGKCVFSSEWDKFANVTYEANFGEIPFGDITKLDENVIPDHDILLAGFPCQPFSLAGVSKKKSLGRNHGFLDETQGTLFFDIARILEAKKPKAFMLENVKNLVSHDKGRTFDIITSTLKKIGYSIHYKVLDAKHFVPQHRERIIIVGFNKEFYKDKESFTFPQPEDKKYQLKNILQKKVPDKYTLSDRLWTYLQNYAAKHKAKGNGFGFGIADPNGISRTLSARYYKDGSEILIQKKNGNPRRLTPRECAKLQGFPDEFKIPVSDNQAYRQFGNSVAVPLIESVAKQIKKIL